MLTLNAALYQRTNAPMIGMCALITRPLVRKPIVRIMKNKESRGGGGRGAPLYLRPFQPPIRLETNRW